MKTIIAGAGLVGCAMAICMKKQGHEVEVFEKRTDPRKDDLSSGRSINLIVTAKAINLFKNLGLWEEVQKITVPVYGRMMHSMTGDLSYQAYGREDEYNNSVSRGMLNNLLIDKAESLGIKIHFDHAIEKVELDKKEIIFENKNEAYDKLFGCDGAGSKVRAAILEKLGDKAKYKVDPLGVDYKEFLMPSTSTGEYAIDKKALHIWPRGKHFLMALPNLDGSFTMTLYMPADWYEKFNTPDLVENYFRENYADALSLMPNLLEEYQKNPQGFLGTVRLSDWTYGDSVALLGDAAHAIVPFFGQGMNCGMSDVEFFRSHADQDWKTQLKTYSDQQKPNGNAIADLSLENFVEMSEKVGDDKFLFKKKIESILETNFPDKYRSRYGLTVYTLTPYHIAQAAGEIQQELISELIRDIDSIEDLCLEKAEKLIDGMLTPWYKSRGVQLDKVI